MKHPLLLFLQLVTINTYSQSFETGYKTGLSNWHYTTMNSLETKNKSLVDNTVYIKKNIHGFMFVEADLNYNSFNASYTPTDPIDYHRNMSVSCYQLSLLLEHQLFTTKGLTLYLGINVSDYQYYQNDNFYNGLGESGTDNTRYSELYAGFNASISYKLSKHFKINFTSQYQKSFNLGSGTGSMYNFAPSHSVNNRIGIGYTF